MNRGELVPSDDLKAAAERRSNAPTRRTPGLFFARPGTTTIWSANGDTLVAECHSRHLSVAGNRANAAYLALAPALESVVVRLLPLVDGRDDDAQAVVAEAEQLLARAQAASAPLERAA